MKTDELQEQVFALVRKQVGHLREPVLTPATHLSTDLEPVMHYWHVWQA